MLTLHWVVSRGRTQSTPVLGLVKHLAYRARHAKSRHDAVVAVRALDVISESHEAPSDERIYEAKIKKPVRLVELRAHRRRRGKHAEATVSAGGQIIRAFE